MNSSSWDLRPVDPGLFNVLKADLVARDKTRNSQAKLLTDVDEGQLEKVCERILEGIDAFSRPQLLQLLQERA